MKRLGIALLLVFLLGTASAETFVLPQEASTFPQTADPDGVTRLEWDGPPLPSGTVCEVLDTVVTGWDCRLTEYEEAVHKFSRVAYTKPDGETGETWVMNYSLSRAQLTRIYQEEDALAYAQRFFRNQYVRADDGSADIRLARQNDGWRAVICDAEGNAAHELWMDYEGRIQLYQDLSYEAPDLSRGFAHDESLAKQADAYDLHAMLEWSSRELLPEIGFNSVAAVACDEESTAFTFIIDGFDFYAAFAAEPQARLLAYGDMRTNTRYGSCMSRDDACLLAALALEREYNAQAFSMLQADFCAKPYFWTNAYVPLPYWCFRIEVPGQGVYQVLIDSQNGGVLEMTPPDRMPKG